MSVCVCMCVCVCVCVCVCMCVLSTFFSITTNGCSVGTSLGLPFLLCHCFVFNMGYLNTRTLLV